MTAQQFWCSHCGQQKPLKPGYLVSDPRYAIVACKSNEDGSTRDYAGLSDERAALKLVREAKERKEAAEDALDALKARRIEEARKERERRAGRL